MLDQPMKAMVVLCRGGRGGVRAAARETPRGAAAAAGRLWHVALGTGAQVPAEEDWLTEVSTDAIIPARHCLETGERLGHFALVGLRGEGVRAGQLMAAGAQVLVAGALFGCGSSRETAPWALRYTGIRLVIAPSFGPIFRHNCDNIGLLTTTDVAWAARLARGELLDVPSVLAERGGLEAEILQAGGLAGWHRTRQMRQPVAAEGRAGMGCASVTREVGCASVARGPARARAHLGAGRTLAQKILAAHLAEAAPNGVKPGAGVWAQTDLRFSHDYVTPMAAALFRAQFGAEAQVQDPGSVLCFADHLVGLHDLLPDARHPARRQAAGFLQQQADFAGGQGLRSYARGAAICHQAILEEYAAPGMLIAGTDSHTSAAGALGALALGVGATAMAAAWYSRSLCLRVPESVRVELSGALPIGVMAKDLMLWLLSPTRLGGGRAAGAVVEFGGPGLAALSVDARATLCNMAVEAGALTGICGVDGHTAAWLATRSSTVAASPSHSQVSPPDRMVRLGPTAIAAQDAHGVVGLDADPNAEYRFTVHCNLGSIEPMVALPGSPQSGRPLAALPAPVPIDIAYGGSCTGAKAADLAAYHAVFAAALQRGQSVAPQVRCYVQAASAVLERAAKAQGLTALLTAVGAHWLSPGCGACINAGLGASVKAGEVTVSAQNRNYPGRSGPGAVYLASPLTVAASALTGELTDPRPWLTKAAMA